MRKIFVFLLMTFLSFDSSAAMEKLEIHKSLSLPHGYWALSTINMDVTGQAAYVTLALYANAAAYVADPRGNKLREFDYGFTIGGADYAQIFNQDKSVAEIVTGIFIFIKDYRPAPDEPAPFADAEIVP
jgi:hypothetical protein